jgi:hypothetical protein
MRSDQAPGILIGHQCCSVRPAISRHRRSARRRRSSRRS